MGYATAGPLDSAAQLPRHPVAEPSATLSRQMATDLTANSLNPLGGSRNPHGSLRDTGGGGHPGCGTQATFSSANPRGGCRNPRGSLGDTGGEFGLRNPIYLPPARRLPQPRERTLSGAQGVNFGLLNPIHLPPDSPN